mmetsp:Transcript_112846/g.258422  ORF Transcript_112846/g.258422 Transcript_112846/m.258422 type:complete len:181 (+) Transcript_112846:49-591(+)
MALKADATLANAFFSVHGFNRAVALGMGIAWGYAFSRPDPDVVYDVFPLQKAQKFVFIQGYKVKEEDRYAFEARWKDLARYYQVRQGYLFNKLVRAKHFESADYQYFDVMQWSAQQLCDWLGSQSHCLTACVSGTGAAFRQSQKTADYTKLRDNLMSGGYSPTMYKVVVNDTEAETTSSA